MSISSAVPVRVLTAVLAATLFSVAIAAARPPEPAGRCDATLWKHVYNPSRLVQMKSCLVVTGTIRESSVDDDGDQHFLLELDRGQEKLLNKRNMKKKDGFLVVEIVCANPVKLKKVKGVCTGYHNPVQIPTVGAHVRVTGSYVIDGHNGWAEIHPASLIEPIQ